MPNRISGKQVSNEKPKLIPGTYIVVFKNQVGGHISKQATQQAVQTTHSLLTDYKIAKDSLLFKYKYTLKGFSAKLSKKQVNKLRKDPRIKRVVQAHWYYPAGTHSTLSIKTPSYDYFSTSFTDNSQTIPWGISRVNGPFDGTGKKKAWIIGTGIDLQNTDLNVDFAQSASFIANESAQDVVGHGTHVAGLLAANNNNYGIVGVAAGAEVVAVKVCFHHPNSQPHVACPGTAFLYGVEFVENHATTDDIINISLWRPISPNSPNTPLENAIIQGANNGIRFVLIAGNAGFSADYYSPSRINHSNVWTVSAFKQGDILASFSNFGNPPIDYSEPGVDLTSTKIGGGTVSGLDGTSFSAPILAGLLLAVPNGITTDGVVSGDPDGNPDAIAVGKVPPPQQPPSLHVTITGPGTLFSGESGTWTAHISGNLPPSYIVGTFQWYVALPFTQPYQPLPNQNPYYEYTKSFQTSVRVVGSIKVHVIVYWNGYSQQLSDIAYFPFIVKPSQPPGP